MSQPQPTKRAKPVGTVKGIVRADNYWHGGRLVPAGEVLEFPAEVWGYAWDEKTKTGEWKWLPFKFGEAVERFEEGTTKSSAPA